MKVAFIICTNDFAWFNECKMYIDRLVVPEEYAVEVLPIWHAKSMANGYNQGRTLSDAKYKVYLHQDLFIININFIEDIIKIFESNAQIGLIGMVGSNDIQNDRIMWGNWEWGKIYGCNGMQEVLCNFGEVNNSYIPVDCVDGMLIATQYDIEWREDIFDGWHFYDRSICMEYLRQGYISVVPRQNEPWCIHDCGVSALNGLEKYMKIFLTEYKEYFSADCIAKSKVDEVSDGDRSTLDNIADNIEIFVNQRKISVADDFLSALNSLGIMPNKQIVFMNEMVSLYRSKEYQFFFQDNDTVDSMQEKYQRVKFILRRMIYQLPIAQDEVEYIQQLSEYEMEMIVQHNLGHSMRRAIC